MSGHSKWANIKIKKGKTDALRGKIFTKIGREIAIAVREGGSNPDSNSKLRDVIAKAKSNNMPNDNIQRSIKKAAGELGNVDYEEITYEGYAPGGVAVIVETITDSRNRTAANMRHYFDKYGGNLGASGCVAWSFDRKGVLVIDNEDEGLEEDTVMMDALDAGAEDFSNEGECFEITTDPDDFNAVADALTAKGYSFVSAQVEMVPQNYQKLEKEEDIKNMEKLLDMMEDDDDVQNVWHNWDNE